MARFSTEADTALSLLSHPAAVWQQPSATGQCVGRRPLGAAVAERPDPHRAAVGLVAVARHPAAALQPVEDASDGGGVQPGPPGEGARAEGAVTADEIEAPADLLVEQGQLDAQLAQ